MKIKFLAVYGLFFILPGLTWAQQQEDYAPEYSPLNIQNGELFPFKYGINVRSLDSNVGTIIVANGVNQGTIESFEPHILKPYPENVCWFQYNGTKETYRQYVNVLLDHPNFTIFVDPGYYEILAPHVEHQKFRFKRKDRTKVILSFLIDLDIREKTGNQECLGKFEYKVSCTKYPLNPEDTFFSLEDLKQTFGVTDDTVLAWK